MYWNTRAVYSGASSDPIHCSGSGGAGVIGCGLGNHQYFNVVLLGLGVQAPTPEWGAMLNEAKNVLTSNPTQMIVPGIAIVILVSVFNLMGDAIRDVLDPKEVA